MADVRLEKVSKSYGKHTVVEDFNVTIRDGECFTFLGPSGCGKTVVLRLIAGFEQLSGGDIYIGDTLVSSAERSIHLPPEKRNISVVFQDYAVWPHRTAFENVIYPLKIQRIAGKEATERTMSVMREIGLEGLENRLPFQLSGGQQQRVALGRALVSRPEIMLLDEPLSNLDANLREEMRFEIKELQRNTGVTILYVTHDQEVALAISDRMAIMDREGQIRQVGAPDELYENPADAFVFKFLGISNFIPLFFRDGDIYIEKSDLRLGTSVPPDILDRIGRDQLVAACRPYDIKLSKENGGVTGVIRRVAYLGPIVDYRIELGGREIRVQTDIQDVHDEEKTGLAFREDDLVGITFLDLKWFSRTEIEGEVT
jgi:iron(III) transport system ATP-binding protein